MNGKQFLDTFAENAASSMSALLEQLFGGGLDRAAFGAITYADLVVCLIFLAAVLAINLAIGRALRRRMQPGGAAEPKETGQALLVQSVGKPLYLLIWICGLYFAVTPFLMKIGTADQPHPLQQFFGYLFNVGVFGAIFWLFHRFTHVIEKQLARWAARSDSQMDDVLVPLVGKSLRVIVPVLAIIMALPVIGLSPAYSGFLSKASSILVIGAVAWILFQAVNIAEKVVLQKFDIRQADNLEARKIYTQVHVLSKTLYVVIGIFAIASVLMLFEDVRRLGTSILASAGVLGIIIGFAAQRTIANLFAGFQLAMTQPIRLDDVVIVENEWGRIEEITLTYVVIRIWDERRLIVPLSYFIERPFQNWTRVSAQLLGAVTVFADYSLPLDAVRKELKRIIEGSPEFDGRFWNLVVVESTERTMQIRVLATSADSSKSWDLRCRIREELIVFIQTNYPQCLPKVRVMTGPVPEPGFSAATT